MSSERVWRVLIVMDSDSRVQHGPASPWTRESELTALVYTGNIHLGIIGVLVSVPYQSDQYRSRNMSISSRIQTEISLNTIRASCGLPHTSYSVFINSS